MRIIDYLPLYRLGRRRLRSETDYRSFQAFQAALLLRYLRRLGIDVRGRRILDLGSGIGGYSQEMARVGARVISVDLLRNPLRLGRGHLPVVGDALSLPLPDEAVEFIFCGSLIEHVTDPGLLLSEIYRVLTVGGHCYLSFPPFYSPMGGHEFSPYHYFGERLAIRLTRGRSRHPQWVVDRCGASNDPRAFSESFRNWGLFKMTVAKARRLIASSGLQIREMSTRYLPVSLIRWPLLGELLTWHAQFVLLKARL